MRYMPAVVAVLASGRDVVRFRFDANEETPALAKKDSLSRETRKLLCDALQLTDSGSLTLGELAEEFQGCPAGSACGRFLGSEGTILHVVSAAKLTELSTTPAPSEVANFVDDAGEEPATFDENNPPDGTPGVDAVARRLVDAEDDVEHLRAQLRDAQNDVRDVRSMYDESSRQVTSVANARDALQDEVELLRSALKDANVALDKATEALSAEREEHAKTASYCEGLRQERDALRNIAKAAPKKKPAPKKK
jgi:peptidoglycan hydrolase CwlO-like protein